MYVTGGKGGGGESSGGGEIVTFCSFENRVGEGRRRGRRKKINFAIFPSRFTECGKAEYASLEENTCVCVRFPTCGERK